MCVRVKSSIFHLFFLLLESDSERVQIRVCQTNNWYQSLRSTCGDATEDRGGELIINWHSAAIRESGDKL